MSVSSSVRIRAIEGKGWGVVAARPIAAGEVLEEAPVIVIPEPEIAAIKATVLDTYLYDWEADGRPAAAIAFGHGSLYNHSVSPNAAYEKDLARGVVSFRALRDVAEGEELCINYNGDPADTTPIWFDGQRWGKLGEPRGG